jgi:AcrR family transcriptional regulator
MAREMHLSAALHEEVNCDSLLCVPYRPTARTEARRAEVRERIVRSARDLIARGGYAEARMAAVADAAGVATGTVYRHFPSKAELFAEVFRRASQREVDAMAEAARPDGRPAAERAATAAAIWARRALRGRRLAYALLAEPVDPLVEAERLAFRGAYRNVIASLIEDGVAAGELPEQDPEVTAAALVGALGEALVGPLSPTATGTDADELIAQVVSFWLRALGAASAPVTTHRKEPVDVNA